MANRDHRHFGVNVSDMTDRVNENVSGMTCRVNENVADMSCCVNDNVPGVSCRVNGIVSEKSRHFSGNVSGVNRRLKECANTIDVSSVCGQKLIIFHGKCVASLQLYGDSLLLKLQIEL